MQKTETRPKLAQELETWAARKAELLETARGKFVVIYGADVVGIFESDPEAITFAYRHLGRRPFLIRQIQEHDEHHFVSGAML